MPRRVGYWLAVQALAIAAGVWAGLAIFNAVAS